MTKEQVGTNTAIYNKLCYNCRGQLAEIRAGTSDTSATDYFFFRAADGIRDKLVTGVQTCALPICPPQPLPSHEILHAEDRHRAGEHHVDGFWLVVVREQEVSPTGRQNTCANGPGLPEHGGRFRSEERRVGKEGRSRLSASRIIKER